jgi:3-methylcrotonyl-CoA carboxylase alpha subunit/geranyl-CoA carboxylase alpha subunit
LPGYQGEDQSDARFQAEAGQIGYPIMVKAVAGGGGRGMRQVAQAAQLPAALQSARSEAASAFGSAELLIEKALLKPRHVEVQVFADAQGHCVHLGERDCSVQRRHQKIIEESPSPAVDAALRARMGGCAVALAQAAGYVGAGTVEFLLDERELSAAGPPQGAKALPEGSALHEVASVGASFTAGPPQGETAPSGGSVLHEVKSVGAFYLMEMNTRLQVEHPVTEAVTGLDLVEWQLRVAQGEPLPLTQEQVVFSGHAIEVRLCAEDEHFTPHTGQVLRFREPAGVRFDHALFAGLQVPPYYDALLGKLVAHAATREAAIDQLAAALDHTEVLGLPTNRAFLAACLRHPRFQAGHALIPFLAEEGDAIREVLQKKELLALVSIGPAALFIHENGSRPAAGVLPCSFPRPVRLRHREVLTDVAVSGVPAMPQGALAVRVGSQRWHVQQGGVDLFVEDASFEAAADAAGTLAAHELHAPFNGKVLAVKAAPGMVVRKGDTLLVIESMKLEHSLAATRDATVKAVLVEPGQQAATLQLLLTFETA